MARMMTTHRLRKCCEPTVLWHVQAGAQESITAVPGLWTDVPGLENWRGETRYRKELTCAGTLRFRFGGIDPTGLCMLDDAPLSVVPGHLIPFDAVAEDVPYGKHTLTVALSPCEDAALCGISRSVIVEQLGGAYLTDLAVSTQRKGRGWMATLSVTVVSLRDETQTVDVEAKAGDSAIHWKKRSLPPRGRVTLTACLPVPGAEAWSPASPRLYAAEAVLWLDGEPADDLLDRFGFTLPASIHAFADDSELSALNVSVPSTQQLLQAVQRLRADGRTALRCQHPNPDPRLLDLCDELGVWVSADCAEPGCHPCLLNK